MSHAAVIVAPTKEQVTRLGVEGAVSWEMEPFDENGTWFRDGSRWDWYQIGGRFTGMLTGYNPYTDAANQETCNLCSGSGIRPSSREQFGEEWFTGCNGCNGCNGTGKRVAYQLKPYSGDVRQVKSLNLAALREASIAGLKKTYQRAMQETPNHRELLYDVRPDETLDALIARRVGENPLSAYAFLRNRHWHESERMGFFGTSTYTECELKDMDKARANPEAWFGKCLHKDKESGSQVVCWNEPYELWHTLYFKRFVEPLNPDDTLIVVDYHV